jgi:diaminohydroxyphosphoribosylaminopyrimidine deaminase / 5-amino-6-(5-phosphoribosylamino)uracil reductase
MTANHRHYLDLAFQLAEKNLGQTKLNPSVGTVVVKNNSIISSGVTSINGRPHAEFNALENKCDFKGVDLYTTLEPCIHYGVTPPCVNMIIKKKIQNVFYGFDDPDERTHKKAKKILKKKGINAKLIKSKNFKNFYSSYFKNKILKLPLITAKIAISKDYYSINKKSKWITNEHSRKITHLLRSQSDCIFSTSKSINKDNSLLNCRIDGLKNSKPDLFIIDLDLKLKKNLSINKIINKRKKFLITRKKNLKKSNFFKNIGFKILLVDSLNTKNNFKDLFHRIYKLGYSRSFFETGLTFLNTLINLDLLDCLYVFQTKKRLKKNGSNNCSPQFLKKIKLNKRIKVNLNDDSLYKKDF